MFSSIFYEFSNNQKYEPEYIAILQLAISNGWTTPKRNQNFLNNTKIKLLKSEGIFTQLDILYNFKQQSGLEEFCKINWVNPGVYNATQSNPALSPVFEPDKGFKGSITNTTYFSTNYRPSIHASKALLNDIGFFFKSYEVGSANNGGCIFGTRDSSGNNFFCRKADSSGPTATTFHSGSGSALAVWNDDSHIVHTKLGLTHSYYVNGTFSSSTTYTSTSLSTFQMTMFAWNLAGTPGRFLNGGIEYFALGSSYIGTKANILKTIFQ